MTMSSSDAFPFDGSSDAAQLGERSSDAAQLGESSGTKSVSVIRLGSFNIGVYQSMLDGKNKDTCLRKIEDVITLCVQDFALDIMCLCELGGHKQGFHACRPPIRPEDLRVFQICTAAFRHRQQQLLGSMGFCRRFFSVWRTKSRRLL